MKSRRNSASNLLQPRARSSRFYRLNSKPELNRFSQVCLFPLYSLQSEEPANSNATTLTPSFDSLVNHVNVSPVAGSASAITLPFDGCASEGGSDEGRKQGKLCDWFSNGAARAVALGGLGLGWLGLGQPILGAETPTRVLPDRSVILLLLVGGPSQLETWDPKPDAPSEVRGPFESIATRCSRAFASPSTCRAWPRGWIAWRSSDQFTTKKRRFTRLAASFSRPAGCARSASKPPISAQ